MRFKKDVAACVVPPRSAVPQPGPPARDNYCDGHKEVATKQHPCDLFALAPVIYAVYLSSAHCFRPCTIFHAIASSLVRVCSFEVHAALRFHNCFAQLRDFLGFGTRIAVTRQR